MTKRIGWPLALGIAGAAIGGACGVASAQPASIDIGTMNSSRPVTTSDVTLPLGAVVWFKFTVRDVPAGGTLYLDVDDNGSSVTPPDTMIGLYDAAGNRIVVDDDGGQGALSAFSFGATSPSRPGMGEGGTSFAGQNGALASGTYYLAIVGYPAVFGQTGWNVAPNGPTNGTIILHATLGPATTPLAASAGVDQSVPSGSVVTLDGSTSGGAAGCDRTLSWAQVAGPAVALNVADPAHPTFTAPAVPAGGATLTFQLTAGDCEGGTAAAVVNVGVTNVNHAPVASAGVDQTVAEGSPVTLDASASYDADNDVLGIAWAQTGGPAVALDQTDPVHPTFTAPTVGAAGATLEFTVYVSDGLETASSVVRVTVQNVNHPPVASAGTSASYTGGSVVTLDASASSDPDGDPLTFAWMQVSGTPVTLAGADTATPTFTAPSAAGTLVFRVTVGDGLAYDVADVSVAIQGTGTPPNCAHARPSTPVLWPPNHAMVPVVILGLDCRTTVEILGVTQDEPINGLGDGDTGPDAVVRGGFVLLRAERAGGRNGRVYHVTFRASNAGGSCTGTVTVSVPKDMGRNRTAVDDGGLYTSTGP